MASRSSSHQRRSEKVRPARHRPRAAKRGSLGAGGLERSRPPTGAFPRPRDGSLPVPGSLLSEAFDHLLADLAKIEPKHALALLAVTAQVKIEERVPGYPTGPNAGRVLALVLAAATRGGAVSRRDLVEVTGLTLSSVRKIRKRLADLGLVLQFSRGTERGCELLVRKSDPLLKAAEAISLNGKFGPTRTKIERQADRDFQTWHKLIGGDTKAVPRGDTKARGTQRTKGGHKGPSKGGHKGRDKGDTKTETIDKFEQLKKLIRLTRERTRNARVIRSTNKTSHSTVPSSPSEKKGPPSDRSRTRAKRPRFLRNRKEQVRLLKLKAPTGPDLQRRRQLVRALSARFNRAYTKAWRDAFGSRSGWDHTEQLRDAAVRCGVQGVEPADYIEWATKEFAFTGVKLAKASVLSSPKVWARFLIDFLSKRAPAKRKEPRHAGFSYDYTLEVKNLRRRLKRAGLDGVDDLTDKDVSRIEKLCKHAVAAGKPPVHAERLRPFVDWAWPNIYAKRRS